MENLVIGGVLLGPVIVALVELCKKFGVSDEYAPWATGVLAVLGFALMQFVIVKPEHEPIVVLALGALILFLEATGLYHRTVKQWRA